MTATSTPDNAARASVGHARREANKRAGASRRAAKPESGTPPERPHPERRLPRLPRGRVRIPYANDHGHADPPHPGADNDWDGVLRKTMPGITSPDQLGQISGGFVEASAISGEAVDGSGPRWQMLAGLPNIGEAREALKEGWRDSPLRADGMTLKEYRYVNWEGWSCSDWVDGFRGLVTHAPGRWNPRRWHAPLRPGESDGFFDHIAMIIDRDGLLMGVVSQPDLRSRVADGTDPAAAVDASGRGIAASDNGWATRADAEAAVSAVLTDNDQGRPTHARLDGTLYGQPMMRYLVGDLSPADETFLMLA